MSPFSIFEKQSNNQQSSDVHFSVAYRTHVPPHPHPEIPNTIQLYTHVLTSAAPVADSGYGQEPARRGVVPLARYVCGLAVACGT